MTTRDWFANPSNAVALKQLLDDDTLKRAFDVLIYSKLPTPTALPENEVLVHAAIVNARREGYYTFYRDLQALVEEPKTQQDLSKPWKGKHVTT